MFFSRLTTVVAVGLTLFVVTAGQAVGHAQLSRSVPADGETLAAPPAELEMRFTEPPSANARIEVFDGCDRDVAGAIDVLNDDMTVALAEGQPGVWRVKLEVVSGADGHSTTERIKFEVEGEADCDLAADDGAAVEDDEGGGVPGVVLVAIGAGVVLAGLAFALRRGGQGS